MQKSKLLMVAMCGALMLPVASCKKGENDPASLSSRTKRLVGTWALTESQSRMVNYNIGLNTSSITYDSYDGIIVTSTDTVIIGASTTGFPSTTYSYTSEIAIDKDGSFKWDQVSGGNAWTGTGFWYWGGKSEANDQKKKEMVLYTITQTNDGSIDSYEGSAIPVDGSWQLDRLAKDEMWVISNIFNTYDNGDTYLSWSVMKFAKQ